MKSQTKKWVSLLCALALTAGLVILPAGAAMPLLGETAEVPAEAAAPGAAVHSAAVDDSSADLAAAGGFMNAAGQHESAYATWKPAEGVSKYTASIIDSAGKETQLDDELIRQYPGYMRVDALGLKAGTYQIKVTANTGATMTTEDLTVTAYDRSGYAFADGHEPGAYNMDGTLKENAKVVYITQETASTVKLGVDVKGKGEDTEVIGLPGILDAYKKGKETDPLCIRIIGTVANDYSGAKAHLPGQYSGLEITGTNHEGAATSLNNKDYKGDICYKEAKAPLTIEGVGNDAVLYGIGLRFCNVNEVEVRNLGSMNCNSDEADSIGFQPACEYVWVHNCDIFYGMKAGDADQAKGDGSLDTKGVKHATLSYNHFWDSGKACLCGLDDNMDYLTYHHNWFDHSDSRHPRVRYTDHCHVYNNYYDDNAKHGVGATTGSSIFVENNYFRNCQHPMLISEQGSDGGTFSGEDGGMIKAFGNYIEGGKAPVPYSQDHTEFDYYDAGTKDEKVPAEVKAKKGGTGYNNFDTDPGFYTYKLDNAADVPTIVKAEAGRQGGSDFDYQIQDNSDVYDSSHKHIQPTPELAEKINGYKSSLVKVGGTVDGAISGEHTHDVTYWKETTPGSCNPETQALIPGEETEYCTSCGQPTGKTRQIAGHHTDDGTGKCSVCGATISSTGGGSTGGGSGSTGTSYSLKASDFTMTKVYNENKSSDLEANEMEDETGNYFHANGKVIKRHASDKGNCEGTRAEFFEMPKNGTDGISFTVTNAPATIKVEWGSPKEGQTTTLAVKKKDGTVLSTESKDGKGFTTTVTAEEAGEYLVTSDDGVAYAARVMTITVTEAAPASGGEGGGEGGGGQGGTTPTPNVMDGADRDLEWSYASGQLTVTGMEAGDQVMAATYDAAGRMTGVKVLASDTTTAVSATAAKMKLFWLGAKDQPMSAAATVYGN